MYCGNKVVVVMPAYNASKTLVQSFNEVCDQNVADTIIIVDDHSTDNTAEIARSLSHEKVNIIVHRHEHNRGYGGNQKTCYKLALENGADIVVMVHPDCQYTPKLLIAMVSIITANLHPCVLASRILGGYAIRGGMPIWKYWSNRFLTASMNLLMGAKLSEYHTGYRAFSASLLRRLPLEKNTDDFAFDAQMLAEIIWDGGTIGEVSCPTVYFKDASSINFRRSCVYGLGCLAVSIMFRLCRWHLARSSKFPILTKEKNM